MGSLPPAGRVQDGRAQYPAPPGPDGPDCYRADALDADHRGGIHDGDTLNASIRNEVFRIAGEADEQVVPRTADIDSGALAGPVMPEQLAAGLETELMPWLAESIPAINLRTQLSEPALTVSGIDPVRVVAFGGVRDIHGETVDLATLPEDGVVLGEEAADRLDAQVGDTLIVFARNQPYRLTVVAIAPDSFLTGSLESGSSGGFAMTLARARALLGYEGMISTVMITNPGGVESGVRGSDAAVTAVDAALEGTPYKTFPTKRTSLDAAEEAGNVFLTLFIVFGLFSIAVRILLIFLIFVMLAAERKPEMGMARAIGMKRRNLTQRFLAEGIAYGLVSALAGAALALALSWQLVSSEYFIGSSSGVALIIPWTRIGLFLGIALASVLLMDWIPARRASWAPIASALRYE